MIFTTPHRILSRSFYITTAGIMPVMACVPLSVTFKIDYLQAYRTCK